MTAPLTAAESFLALLDDLGSAKAKPSGAAAAVMLAHAAGHIRQLLERVRELEVVDCEIADEEIDDVLRQAAAQCPEHGVLCKGADCCCADRHQDVPRPAQDAERDTSRPITGPGHPGLWHLPPKAAPGAEMCLAESPRDPARDLAYWSCTARRGHAERWHAEHRIDGTPYADEDAGAAWPVAAKETGLPVWAGGSLNRGVPVRECGAVLAREPGTGAVGFWRCNAVSGHAPLDHVAFAPWESRLTGAVLARWASVHPGPQRCLNCGAREGEDCRSWCRFKPAGRAMVEAEDSEVSGQRDGRTAAGSAERPAPSAGRGDAGDDPPAPAGAGGHALHPPLPADVPGDPGAIPAGRIGDAAPLPDSFYEMCRHSGDPPRRHTQAARDTIKAASQ